MRLGIGTAQFGLNYGIANHYGQVSRDQAVQIISLARQNGIDTIDTAISYGSSETCLGNIGTKDFRVITKLPRIPEACPNVTTWVLEQVKNSLQRLGLTSVYGLILHRTMDLKEPNGKQLAFALKSLKDSGMCSKLGISIYSPSELDAVFSSCPIDLVQAPFNILDQRLARSGWLKRLHDNGVEIHARSIFLQGLLLLPKLDIPSKFARWGNIWEMWHDWQFQQKISPIEACLSCPLAFHEIDRVIIGVDTAAHLEQIIKAEGKILASQINLPNFKCEDERLINPSNWNYLEKN